MYLQELFTGVGKVRSSNILRPGHAEVVFANLADAQAAISRYNGRELDGSPMYVSLATCVDGLNSIPAEQEPQSKPLTLQCSAQSSSDNRGRWVFSIPLPFGHENV